jgi:hypothetical protein
VLSSEELTKPDFLAVAVTYTGIPGRRKGSFAVKLISIRSISFVIAEEKSAVENRRSYE